MTADDDTAVEFVAWLRARCAALGFDLDEAGSSLVERMRLLATCSKVLDDAKRMSTYADRIFRHYDETKPARAFTPLERQTIVLACLFSDIGKTGPAGADADARKLVAEAFAIDNVGDDTQPVQDFLRVYFAGDAEDRVARLRAMGLDPTMSVRQFWNLHTGWTLEIAEAAGLPLEAVAAAATHHRLEDINPQAIVGDDDRFTRRFGENATFDRAEKLVIVLDKYDAVTRRGRRTHEEAITWLRDRLARSVRYRDDPEFRELLADIDAVLGANAEQ